MKLMPFEYLILVSCVSWIYLALFHGRFWQPLMDEDTPPLKRWPDVDVIVPARNEADVLSETLPFLLDQDYPGLWRIILVNDHSEDNTVATAKILAQRAGASDRLTVINAPALENGWRGKTNAMRAGLAESRAAFVLFTDADIRHPPFSLRLLVARAQTQERDLTSLMVKLNVRSQAEKLLIPAFVFFFAMLYPFRRANDPKSKIAAAAGGVMLVRRAALDAAGGLEKIKGALIDDCALAKIIKSAGGSVCLTLTKDVVSLRAYPRVQDITDMIARTAFDQLRYSYLLMALAVLGLGLLFIGPLLGLLINPGLSAVVLLLMLGLYVPTVVFYGLPLFWAAALPFAAIFYIVATIQSAVRHSRGAGSLWKGRTTPT